MFQELKETCVCIHLMVTNTVIKALLLSLSCRRGHTGAEIFSPLTQDYIVGKERSRDLSLEKILNKW